MSKVTVIGIVGNSVFLPVDHFHVGGETIEASDAHFEYGGKGFNQAVAAARFGAEVTFIAAVGQADTEAIGAFLEQEGITAKLSPKTTATAFAAIVTDKNGSNRVTVFQGAQLNPADILAMENSIKEADILLLNNEVDEAVNICASEFAEKYGVKIILNPAPERPTDKALLDRIAWFTPNEHEAAGLEDYPNVIQTLGDKGCYIKAEERIIPSMKVKAVDTTGAGDTFNGVLAAELALGKTLETAVQSAVRASGNSVTKKGAVSSIPHRAEVEGQ